MDDPQRRQRSFFDDLGFERSFVVDHVRRRSSARSSRAGLLLGDLRLWQSFILGNYLTRQYRRHHRWDVPPSLVRFAKQREELRPQLLVDRTVVRELLQGPRCRFRITLPRWPGCRFSKEEPPQQHSH